MKVADTPSSIFIDLGYTFFALAGIDNHNDRIWLPVTLNYQNNNGTLCLGYNSSYSM